MILENVYSWFVGFPWTRLAYSSIILALVAVLVTELWTVWSPRKVTLGNFSYFDDGTQDGGRTQSLALNIRHHMGILNDKLAREHARREEESQLTGNSGRQIAELPTGEFVLGREANLIGEIDLAFQGVNLSKVLTALRTRVAPPDAVSGTVSRREERATATVSWRNAPRPSDDTINNRLMHFSGTINDDEIAEMASCSLAWSQAVGTIKNQLARLDHMQYCAFAKNWAMFVDVRNSAETGNELTQNDISQLDAVIDAMGVLIEQKVEYSEVYLLRANAIDLLPEADPNLRSLAVADYSVHDRRNEDLLPSQIRDEILAAVKPAGSVPGVGFVRRRSAGQSFLGTGWLIAPDIVAVPGFVVFEEVNGSLVPDYKGVEFVIADALETGSPSVFEATGVINISPPKLGQSVQIALIRFEELASAGLSPLPISGDAAVGGMKGTIVAFEGNVLTQTSKALSVVTVEPLSGTITHDAETFPGSAGAPILNERQEVVGIHFGKQTTSDGVSQGAAVSATDLSMLLQ